MLSSSLAFEFLIIWHEESQQIVFFHQAPDINFSYPYINRIDQVLQSGKIKLPTTKGAYQVITINRKYAVMVRDSPYIYVLIIHAIPDNEIKNLFQNFLIRLKSRWLSELENLYGHFKGNIQIFLQTSPNRPNLPHLVDEVFALHYKLKYKVISNGNSSLKGLQLKIFRFAEELTRDSGYFLLEELLDGCVECFSHSKNRQRIAQEILKLYQKKYFNLTKESKKNLL